MKGAGWKAGGHVSLPRLAATHGFVLLLLPIPGLHLWHLWVQGLAGVLVLAAVVFALAWWVSKNRAERLQDELQQAQEEARAREKERDLAQGELLLRLDQERELNQQKMQLQAQLADYEKYAALAQMALGAAHEINNPLLGILSHLELELKTADTEAHSEIEQCIESAKRIAATTRGLLNYTRPDPMRVSRIQLGRLQHQPMLRALRVENRVTSELPAIHADSQQLSQVLMNVLLNAAEATPAGGSIVVEAEHLPASESAEIRVIDSGAGIPADILPHVFEPFFTTKHGKGTGLGLSISQAYVRSHGGEIRLQSQEGAGTTVRITLPLRRQPESGVEEEKSEVVV